MYCFLMQLFLLQLAAAQKDTLPSFVKDSLDIYVNRALTDWQIPGRSCLHCKEWKSCFDERLWCKRNGNQ